MLIFGYKIIKLDDYINLIANLLKVNKKYCDSLEQNLNTFDLIKKINDDLQRSEETIKDLRDTIQKCCNKMNCKNYISLDSGNCVYAVEANVDCGESCENYESINE